MPGFAAIVNQTARLLLIHVVRTYALAHGETHDWLRGLSDPKIARALACIHREPARTWSVAELAREAGMSRSLFANRFQEVIGQPPMRYLCTWRIHLTREALAAPGASVTRVSHDLGYSSDAAFRTALRRITGAQPKDFRHKA